MQKVVSSKSKGASQKQPSGWEKALKLGDTKKVVEATFEEVKPKKLVSTKDQTIQDTVKESPNPEGFVKEVFNQLVNNFNIENQNQILLNITAMVKDERYRLIEMNDQHIVQSEATRRVIINSLSIFN